MEKEKANNEIGFKSHILLPIFFILTLAVTIVMAVVDNFSDGLSSFVVWMYFGVLQAYCCVSIFDVCSSTTKSKNLKIFVTIMICLSIIVSFAFILAFLLF